MPNGHPANPGIATRQPPPHHPTPALHHRRRPNRRRRRTPAARHGGEQQHHGVRDAAGADLRGAGDRVGGLVRLRAGGRVRAPGALARRHPRRAAPPRRPGGLRRRLLEPPRPPRLLPLRHGRAHRAHHRAPRLRLRRHPGLRRLPRPRPRLRRLPPRRILHVAPRIRLRRPRPVGEDQGLPRRLRHLQEAPAPGRLRQRRAVLPVTPLPAPVGLLQAAVGVRVHVREPDGVDEPGAAGGGPGLRAVEQPPRRALLRVRVLQGRPPGGAPRPVAQGQHRARRRHRLPRLPLPHRVQRLQERPGRRLLPPLQVITDQSVTATMSWLAGRSGGMPVAGVASPSGWFSKLRVGCVVDK